MRYATLPLSIFDVKVGNYEHFTIDADTANLLGTLVIAICVGAILAALYNFYIRNIPGSIVRALLRAQALSPESAVDIETLALPCRALVRFELRRGSALSRMVQQAPSSEQDGECAPQPPRYYIPEEAKYRAELRFSSEGNGLVALILTSALSVGLAALVIALLPWFLGVIDKIL